MGVRAAKNGGWWRNPWWATGLLALTSVIAAEGFVDPVCFLEGSATRVVQRGQLIPQPYAPELAPFYLVILMVAMVWAAVWSMSARKASRSRLALLHVGIPLIPLAFFAWRASHMSYACNPF